MIAARDPGGAGAIQRTAMVVGGSIGGLFAANMLHRAGWDVQVFERVAGPLEGRGTGIVTHPELMVALQHAGVVVDDAIGIAVRERVTLARDGSVLGRTELPQILTAWARIYHLLRAALPGDRYHHGKQLESFQQSDRRVVATFADGSRAEADLMVAADGIRSTVRQALLPRARPQYAGYIAWRGLVEESALSDRALAEVFPYFAFGLPPREQMIGYPVAGRHNAVEPGSRRFNFVWYRPADEATTLLDMLTDETGKVWPEGIPPPLIRAGILQQARQAARDVLAPQFAELVEKTEGLFFQPIFDLESPQMAFDRIALLGDSAFVARPHCGMGVTKAAGDALALVQALTADQDVPTALARYAQERTGFGSFIVDHARALGAYMQAQLRTEHERQMAEAYRTPAVIMRETAVSPARP